MTIPFTTSGGLFTRLGHIFGGVADVNAIRGGTATARVLSGALMTTRVNQLQTDYNASPVNQSTLDGVFTSLGAWQSSQSGFLTYLSQLAQSTLVTMANADTALATKTNQAALALLISQMNSATTYVTASSVTIGAQANVGTPNGNPIVVGSKNRGDGLIHQLIFPETLTFACTADSQSGATLNQEPLSITGQAAQADPLSYLWPAGSGASSGVTACDALQNNAGGNKLNNGDFETFTVANTPDQWTIATGSAGAEVASEATIVYGPGLKALKLIGGTGILTALTQTFGSSTGTLATILPDTQYALNFWLKADVVPAAGTLIVELIDQNNNVVADDQSTNNRLTITQGGITTSYVAQNVVFRTPKVLPSTIKLRIRLSVAITAGSNYFIDRMALNQMTQIYPGGPWFSVFSANTKLIAGDSYTVAITNTYGVFQQYFERVFGLRNLGVQLPYYTGSGTNINDNLVV